MLEYDRGKVFFKKNEKTFVKTLDKWCEKCIIVYRRKENLKPERRKHDVRI